MTPPAHLLPGPARHGVTQLAAALAAATGAAALTRAEGPPPARVHLHLTDGLFDDHAHARAVVTGWARRSTLTLTLHDVPQPAEGRAFDARRALYAELIGCARAWATNSTHEADLVRRHVATGARGAVIPLPVPLLLPAPGARSRSGRPELGVLGFVYPDKGHAEVLELAARLRRGGPDVGVVAIGGPPSHHTAFADDLAERARRLGVPFRITGYLPASGFLSAMRGVAVPLVAHARFSASGSMNSWLGAGRRPLVRRDPYSEEMDRLRPGCYRLVEPYGWDAAVLADLADPGRTRLPARTTPPHGLAEAAAAYLDWWRGS